MSTSAQMLLLAQFLRADSYSFTHPTSGITKSLHSVVVIAPQPDQSRQMVRIVLDDPRVVVGLQPDQLYLFPVLCAVTRNGSVGYRLVSGQSPILAPDLEAPRVEPDGFELEDELDAADVHALAATTNLPALGRLIGRAHDIEDAKEKFRARTLPTPSTLKH